MFCNNTQIYRYVSNGNQDSLLEWKGFCHAVEVIDKTHGGWLSHFDSLCVYVMAVSVSARGACATSDTMYEEKDV